MHCFACENKVFESQVYFYNVIIMCSVNNISYDKVLSFYGVVAIII